LADTTIEITQPLDSPAKFLTMHRNSDDNLSVSAAIPIDREGKYQRAINDILVQYGDAVSISEKAKPLRKWGENLAVQTTTSVIMTMKAGTQVETMLSTNGITTVSSSSGSDTQNIDFYEGHTISGSNLTFAQENTDTAITGQTNKTLPTALARCTRARLSSPAVGDIYFHEGGATTGGVPNDGTTVHLVIPAGEIQSQKASTSLSSVDYWIVDSVTASVLSKTSAWAQVRVEMKRVSETNFYPITQWLGLSDSTGTTELLHNDEYLVIPKNSDVRMVGKANTANIQVAGGMSGPLAIVT